MQNMSTEPRQNSYNGRPKLNCCLSKCKSILKEKALRKTITRA